MSGEESDSDKLFREIQEAAQKPNQQPATGQEKQNGSLKQILPNYEILNEIHRGGQGVVYRATQNSTNRIVALKLILQGSFATERQRFRFEREVEFASQLNHPNIVTVYDGGIANNQPFLAMELVSGSSLSRATIDNATNPTNDRERTEHMVRLFEKICRAIGYAHSKGVIHRDLKPANILVAEDGEPHVVDFGLAKLMGNENSPEHSPRTMTGEFLGTLSYASPEQASGDPTQTDTRSDVYSLGVVFCELLTGQMPYDVTGSIAETLSNISHCEPVVPAIANPEIDFDLKTIVLKSLSKDPDRRYQNAGELADDLRRYLDGEPISARRDSSYVFCKTVKRHRQATFAAASFLVLLICSLIAITVLYLQAARDRDHAETSEKEESRQRSIADAKAAEAETARRLEALQKEEAEFRGYAAGLAASDASIRAFDVFSAVTNLSKTSKKHRHFEWWYLLNRVDLAEKLLGGFNNGGLQAHPDGAGSVDYDPNNGWIVSGGWAGNVVFWNPETETQLAMHRFRRPITCVRAHPDQSKVAVAFDDGDIATIELTNPELENFAIKLDARKLDTLGLAVNEMQFSPNGDQLIVATGKHPEQGKVLMFNWETGEIEHELTGQPNLVFSVAVSPNGEMVASSSNQILLWERRTGKLIKKFPPMKNWIVDVTFNSTGTRLASAANEETVCLWDVESGKLESQLVGHSGFVKSVSFSPDGNTLATSSLDGTVRFWDQSDFTKRTVKWGHVGEIKEVKFSPDGSALVSCGRQALRIWNVDDNSKSGFGAGNHYQIRDTCLTPDSQNLFVSDQKGDLVRWNLQKKIPAERICEPIKNEVPIRAVACSKNGKILAWGNDNGDVSFRVGSEKPIVVSQQHRGPIVSLCFSSDNLFVYSASLDKTIRKWKVGDQSNSVVYESDSPIRQIVLSKKDNQLAIANETKIVVVDLPDFTVVIEIDRRIGPYVKDYRMAFHPDGNQLVAPILRKTGESLYNFPVVWEIPSGRELGILGGHARTVRSVDYSSDGKRIATASEDGTIKIWDTETFY